MYIQKLDDPKKIRRVCISHNVFSLLQYLLISTAKEIKHTFFFFTDDKFSRHFPNSMVFNIKRRGFGRGKYLQGYIFLLRRNKLWPFLKHAEFYAQDNGVQDWVLLKNHNYICLEDGLGSYQEQSQKHSFDGFLKRLPFYPCGIYTWGYGKNCTARLLSHEPAADSFLREKPFIKVDLWQLWQESEKEKQDFIFKIFNISKEDIEFFEKFDHLLLTQCFSEFEIISEDTKIECYKNIVKHFNLQPENTVIKIHPREVTDYSAVFPGFHIYKNSVPIELIALHLKKQLQVYTVSSSGVFIFPEQNVNWCGHKFCKELYDKHGDCERPF